MVPTGEQLISRTLVAALVATGGLAGVSAAVEASPADRALLVVLDVSGSMNEAVPGGVKRDLARRGLLRTFEAMPEGTLTGLRLLGQGVSGDECAASESAVAIAPFAASDWEAALDLVRWDGATPLVYSMREALDELRGANAVQRAMLIIGDGEDPVGVAREEADGVRIHTISLGEAVSHQLAGIALVTNGTYSRAFDETSFGVAAGVAIPNSQQGPDAESVASGAHIVRAPPRGHPRCVQQHVGPDRRLRQDRARARGARGRSRGLSRRCACGAARVRPQGELRERGRRVHRHRATAGAHRTENGP